MKSKFLFLIPFAISLLSGCGQNGNNNANPDKYLIPGETVSTGFFSQKLLELNYIRSTSSDSNRVSFEILYELHYSGESITPLEQYGGYSAVFDQNNNRGGVDMFVARERKLPESIAPNQTITINIGFSCFKDWKEVKVTYSDLNGSSYHFKLKSENFPNTLNNAYGNLRVGESISQSDNLASIRLDAVGKDTYITKDDSVTFIYSISNNTEQQLKFSTLIYCFDDDMYTKDANYIYPGQPTKVEARQTLMFSSNLTINNANWNRCVVKTTLNDSTSFKFNLVHNELNY